MNIVQKNTNNPNLLPKDGTVNYYGKLFDPQESKVRFDSLLENIAWKNDEFRLFGKHIVTKRKIAWYADSERSYTYSNITKTGMFWTKELLELKNIVEDKTNEKYNSCLLNLYHNGSEGMGWHSDDENDMKKNAAIASLSFGAERRFVFKHKKTKEKSSLILKNGSLLVMKGSTQKNWMHSLPPTKKIVEARINLTFRTLMGPG